MRSSIGTELELAKRLAAIGRRLSSSLDFDEILRLIPRSATELLGGSACLLLRDESDVLRVRAADGVDPAAAGKFQGAMEERSLEGLPRALGLPQRAAVTAVPVMSDRTVQGILVHLRETALDAGGTWLLSALADQAAVTLRNSRLHERAVAHERRLEEEVVLARRLSAELEELIYTVAHDLRAPLRAMSGCVDLLLEEYRDRLPPGNGEDYLARIVDGSRRMDALIRDLLAYSHLARAEVDLEPLNLEKVVDGAVAESAPAIQARHAEVRVEVPAVGVRGDEKILQTSIANLLSNAIKFVAPGTRPRATVRAEVRAESVRLSVEDNGIGIDPAYRERIFGLFERLNRAEEYPGTGMGLAIVRKGMERMNGRAGLDSQPGLGSRFWIELPRADCR